MKFFSMILIAAGLFRPNFVDEQTFQEEVTHHFCDVTASEFRNEPTVEAVVYAFCDMAFDDIWWALSDAECVFQPKEATKALRKFKRVKTTEGMAEDKIAYLDSAYVCPIQ